MNERIIFVVFGGTGDLAKRKLAPAIASALESRVLGEGSVLVGISRRDFTDESYEQFLSDSLKTDKQKNNLALLDIRFFRGDASEPNSLNGLSDFIESIRKPGMRIIFYLATSFHLFSPIVEHLKKQGLNRNAIILFEKPFGESLESAKSIESDIANAFKQEDIYRVDHYLAKETVKNISALKFQNIFFEEILNNKHVESIEIIINEDMPVGDRIEYYNKSGAIKDMIQNHLLQVLALILMENPSRSSFQEEKLRALRKLQFKEHKMNILGQHHSYILDAGKKNISLDKIEKTETFARLYFECHNERWKGVNLILQTGKSLHKKEGTIIINFKKKGHEERNQIIIDIYPTQDIRILFNTRNPNADKVEQANFEFCHECAFGPNSVDEYATLIEEAIMGNHIMFPNSAEILESWRLVSSINRKHIPFIVYPDGIHPDKIG
jgi:glucose-6-phosphate 1-dehydrogenase